MKKIMNLKFDSSITKLTEINSSFDSGVLKIAYTNENRNKSYISKESFERAIPSIYNCPVVCNYLRDENDFGGHDMELVSDDEGNMKIVNTTTPVGLVPESAKVYWSEDDGHEYLCADVLIWKRQEAYQRIKDGGITSESMEITVKDGHTNSDTGYYMIDDFEFTAFCLLGDNVTPCFEGASLEVFSKNGLKEQIELMMEDFKQTFTVNTSDEVDDTHPQKILAEGGNTVLENELINESEEVYTAEPELENNDDIQPEEPEVAPAEEKADYALLGNVMEQLHTALSTETISTDFGEYPRYMYADCDLEFNQVYCWDSNDWLLYGFTFNFNGDNIIIDYESKTRMKYTITEFDEGDQGSPFSNTYELLTKKINDDFEQYHAASDKIESMEAELTELREFKANVENTAAEKEREELFVQFEDLVGIEAFDMLKENSSEYDINTLEEKCYAIRGRNTKMVKFSLDNTKPPKILVSSHNEENEPYGGIFKEYNIE